MLALTMPKEVISLLQASLGVAGAHVDQVDDTLMAAILRRLSDYTCPCAPSVLAGAALAAIQPLGTTTTSDLKNQIEESIENLLISGDLLELSRVSMHEREDKESWLFVATPSFVKRPSGRIYIFGIAPDDVPFLPASLACRVRYVKAARFIDPEEGESLADILRSFGLREISNQTWIYSPKLESAQAYLQAIRLRIAGEGQSGDIPGITIIGHSVGHVSYRERWRSPQSDTGIFVARRPRTYGAPIWGVAELKDGITTKFLDLPFKDSRLRGCDIAWRIQLALDNVNGTPATYRCERESNGWLLRLSFPIPLWAQRKLSFIGSQNSNDLRAQPFSFWIPDTELHTEQQFLNDYLWFSPVDSNNNSQGINNG